jgi:hypothetical protein
MQFLPGRTIRHKRHDHLAIIINTTTAIRCRHHLLQLLLLCDPLHHLFLSIPISIAWIWTCSTTYLIAILLIIRWRRGLNKIVIVAHDDMVSLRY